MFILDRLKPKELEEYLKSFAVIAPDEKIQDLTIPGAGNMNRVLRARTENSSLIIKQAHNYVEKYPQIYAPPTRIHTEGAFYELIVTNADTSHMMPEVIKQDPENYILILEDMGDSEDFSFLYHKHQFIRHDELQSLCNYLSALHTSFKSHQPNPIFLNDEMRKLNHQHIFVYPFLEENGLDLDHIQNGLRELAQPYKSDEGFRNIIKDIGEQYLTNGPHLLHGDFYPGSWLKTQGGIRVIDPEFCHYGFAEFDLAVLIAHLHLANQSESLIEQVLYWYNSAIDFQFLQQLTGVEIMRRLIGLAQLPLERSLEEKRQLLSKAYQMIIS
ncbi:phosphotransferase [Dyadobacter tibetensis]|uniref:phosphotransferase n=1 Tax=Dyadobacter tibetensis TaxID=1211851 RepID=UPI0004714E78|nr:phosphotransferase [Dyadobacter tibetensis]